MTSTQIKTLPGGAAPPAGLAAAAVGTGGTFAAATYFWKVTFVTRWGETSGSNEATVAIVLNGSANLTWTAPPAGTNQVKVYRGTVTNTENALVATLGASAAAYTDTGTAGTAQSPPAAGSFTGVTLTSTQVTSPADTTVAALAPALQVLAAQASNEWHNVAGLGDHATAAQKRAAAIGVALQDV